MSQRGGTSFRVTRGISTNCRVVICYGKTRMRVIEKPARFCMRVFSINFHAAVEREQELGERWNNGYWNNEKY